MVGVVWELVSLLGWGGLEVSEFGGLGIGAVKGRASFTLCFFSKSIVWS